MAAGIFLHALVYTLAWKEKSRDGKEREERVEKVEIAEESILGQCLLSGLVVLSLV